MPEDLRLRVLTEGDTRGLEKTAVELDGLADTAEHAERSTKGLGDEVDKTSKKTEGLGRQSKRTGHDIVDLDRRIIELKASLKGLNDEYERSGKFDRKKFGSDSRELSGLQRVKKTLEGLGDETGRWSKLLDSVIDKIPGISGLGKLMGNPAAATVAGVAGAGTLIGVGAIAGGAVTAGVGAGIAGAGIAGAAMQSKAVQDEWSKTLTDIKLQYLDATTSYEQPAIAAIKRIGGAIHDDVDMKAIFGNATKFVEPLADSTAKAIVSIGRGFESLTSKAMPAVVALSNGIQDLGDATGVALDQIGDGSEGGAKALGDFLGVAGDLIMLTGAWIGFFEDSYDAITDMTDGLKELHPFIGLVGGAIDDVTGNGKVSQLSETLDRSATSADGAGGSFENLTAGMYNTADAARELNDRFNDLLGVELSQGEANLKVKQGFADLTEELRDGKRTLDENSQAGRDNVGAIYQQLEALNQKRQADIAAGNGTVEATAAANAAYASQVEAIRQILIKLGFAKSEVDNFLAAFLAIDGKTVGVTINTMHNDYYARQGAGGSAFDAGDRLDRRGIGNARGTSHWRGGWSLVGEEGPELVHMPTGTQVYPADQTSRMLGGSGGGSTTDSGGGGRTLTMNFSGSIDTMFATAFMQAVREGLITIN